jgi:hypothetical protein
MLHRQIGGCQRIVIGADLRLHLCQHRCLRRHAGEPVVDTPRLLLHPRLQERRGEDQTDQHPPQQQISDGWSPTAHQIQNSVHLYLSRNCRRLFWLPADTKNARQNGINN